MAWGYAHLPEGLPQLPVCDPLRHYPEPQVCHGLLEELQLQPRQQGGTLAV